MQTDPHPASPASSAVPASTSGSRSWPLESRAASPSQEAMRAARARLVPDAGEATAARARTRGSRRLRRLELALVAAEIRELSGRRRTF